MPAPITTQRGESRAGRRRKVPFALTRRGDNIRAALAVDDGGGRGLERDDKAAEKNGNRRVFDNPNR